MLNRISSLFLIALSILVCLASVKLGLGRFHEPGPGFMPFLTSCVIFLLAIAILAKDLIGRQEVKVDKLLLIRRNLKDPIRFVVILLGYTFLLEVLGYLITTFLMLFLMLYLFDPKKWGIKIGFSAIAVSLSFLVFCKWLQVQLPAGIFNLGF